LQCPTDETQPCTLTGTNLFLVESLSTAPTFAGATPVPDGYTGTTLSIPHLTAGTLFLHLRDDPNSVDSAIFPSAAAPVAPHTHRGAAKSASTAAAPPTPAADTTSTPTAKQATPAKQTSPAVAPGPSL
jgi:hypothetical protein